MMRFIFLSLMLVLLTAGVGCAKGEMFPEPVQNNQGLLKVMNADGFIGATIPDTAIEYDLIVLAAGGLDIEALSADLVTNDPITFKGGEFPGEGGDCTEHLTSGKTCTIKILYSPENTNSHRADVHFTYQDLIGPKELSFVLTADSHPILRFEYGTRYDFGNKFVGSSTDLPIKITNVGKVNADSLTVNNLGAPYSFKDGSYPGTGGTCGNRILIGESCVMIVNYTPLNNVEHKQDITLNYLNTGRPETNTLHLLAFGFEKAALSLDQPANYDYGLKTNETEFVANFELSHAGGDVSASNIQITGLTAPFSLKTGAGGTTCAQGGSVAQSGHCTIVIALNSPVSGTWTGSFDVTYSNGISTSTIHRNLTAITKRKATVSFSPSASVPFGFVRYNTSATRTVTVTYVSGELPATLTGFATSSNGFSTAAGTCSSTLSSGSCTYVVTFNPVSYSSPNYSGTAVFSYIDGASTNNVSFALSGGTAAELLNNAGSTAKLEFNGVVLGTSTELAVTIRNRTSVNSATSVSASVSGAGFTLGGTGIYPGGGNCTSTVTTSSCTIKVKFTPTALADYSGALNIQYFDGSTAQNITVVLEGTGAPAANLTLTDGTFGTVGVNSVSLLQLTLENPSDVVATGITFSLPAWLTRRAVSSNCSTTLGKTTCKLGIVFNPTAPGTYAGDITVTYQDGSQSRTTTAHVTATAVPDSNLNLSGLNPTYFPASGTLYVGQSSTQTFTLIHGTGATAASGINITIADAEYAVTNSTCGGGLSNGQSCTFDVTVTPTLARTKTVSLLVSYSSGATINRTLSTSSVMPGNLTSDVNSVDFGDVSVGSTSTRVFTITRSGTILSVGLPPQLTSGFRFNGTFPGTTAANGCTSSFNVPCVVVVTFTPSAVGAVSGSFTINYNNGYQAKALTLAYAGVARPIASLSVASVNFGSVIRTLSVQQWVNVTNSGTAAATAISAAALGNSFSYAGGSYPGTGGTCDVTLAAGASCTMRVEFAPTAVAPMSQALRLNYHNGFSTTFASELQTGAGISQAILGTDGTNPYNFGATPVNTPKLATVTIRNSGHVAATQVTSSFGSSVYSYAGGSFPGSGGTCGTTIAAEGSCTVVINFRPTSLGSVSSALTINYEDGLRLQTQILNLQGTGN